MNIGKAERTGGKATRERGEKTEKDVWDQHARHIFLVPLETARSVL